MTSALVIGEALVDVVGGVAHPGGSPLNVAIGLARLGVPTTLLADFGNDSHGSAIAEHLSTSGVVLASESRGERPTSVAEATIGPDGAASYRFRLQWDPPPIDAAGWDLVHTGSLGAALEPGASRVEEALRAASGLVSFDPNIRPALMGEHADAVARIERFVALSEVVKASDEDAAWLYPGAGIRDVLERWAAAGPRLVVVTRGAAGAIAFGDGVLVEVGAPATIVADTIGAGDSFMAGLLDGVLRRGFDDLAATLEFAVRCAAITVSRVGADPPRREEIGQVPA